jgi:hypothetical protein
MKSGNKKVRTSEWWQLRKKEKFETICRYNNRERRLKREEA